MNYVWEPQQWQHDIIVKSTNKNVGIQYRIKKGVSYIVKMHQIFVPAWVKLKC
jgi:hypothetical protein